MPIKILIVDDSEVVRCMLKEILGKNGDWVSVEARNGLEAIRIAKELRPEFAVIDFSMPLMNGLELATELKRLNPRISILMLTGYKDKSLDEKAYKVGVTWVLPKVEGLDKVFDFARILLRPDSPPEALPAR